MEQKTRKRQSKKKQCQKAKNSDVDVPIWCHFGIHSSHYLMQIKLIPNPDHWINLISLFIAN